MSCLVGFFAFGFADPGDEEDKDEDGLSAFEDLVEDDLLGEYLED